MANRHLFEGILRYVTESFAKAFVRRVTFLQVLYIHHDLRYCSIPPWNQQRLGLHALERQSHYPRVSASQLLRYDVQCSKLHSWHTHRTYPWLGSRSVSLCLAGLRGVTRPIRRVKLQQPLLANSHLKWTPTHAAHGEVMWLRPKLSNPSPPLSPFSSSPHPLLQSTVE